MEINNKKEILIQKFLEKTLNEDEKKEFICYYQTDMDFASEVTEFSNMIITINAANRMISETEKRNNIKNLTTKKIVVGIAAILILAFGLWLLFHNSQKSNNQKIYAEFYVTPSITINTMGIDSITINIKKAFRFYEQKDFLKASIIFSELSSKTLEYKLYEGICYMELDNFNHAVDVFEELRSSDSLNKIDAKWYLALCLLQKNMNDKAKEIFKELSKSNNQYSKKSLEILKQL